MQPRWLKLKQAVACYAIGRDRLKRLALAGKIRGHRDSDSKRGDWIFDRESLDQYRLNQIGQLDCEAMAIYQKLMQWRP